MIYVAQNAESIEHSKSEEAEEKASFSTGIKHYCRSTVLRITYVNTIMQG
jgi:hypothetical protein